MSTKITSIASGLLVLCVAGTKAQATTLAKVASASGKLTVELRTESDSLREGYEALSALLRDERGAPIKDAHVRWYPLMTMGEHSHSAPVDDLGDDPDSTGTFRAGIVFVMPSAKDGSWRVRLRIHDHRFKGPASHDSVDLPVTVGKPRSPRLVRFQAKDGTPRFLALVAPRTPKAGSNPLDVFVAAKGGEGKAWPADTGWKVEFTPTMPEMGHGSSGNAQPVASKNGHHLGKVNFSMGGTWRLTFKLQQNATAFVDSSKTLDVDVAD